MDEQEGAGVVRKARDERAPFKVLEDGCDHAGVELYAQVEYGHRWCRLGRREVERPEKSKRLAQLVVARRARGRSPVNLLGSRRIGG